MPLWEPNFDFYEASIEADRAIVTLDLAAADHAPLESHPLRLQIRVKMQKHREDGLRDKDEADALFALEDKLDAALKSSVEALYVGRIVAQGHTEFIYYVPKSQREAIEDPLSLVGDVAPYALEWLSEDDEAWEKYEDLFPNAYALQSIMNRRLVAQMVEIGDQLQVPREIDHVAAFATEAKARAAAAELASKGYRVEPLEPPESPTDAWRVEFHHEESCEGHKPDEFVYEVLDIILPHDGDYDGWGSLVQKN